jgi:carbon monoxide dehydrogenase subunit G
VELNNSFVVAKPVGESWGLLTDLERIAPCMPGAKLTGVEGGDYRGTVKVKVGPIVARYDGIASFVSLDDETRVAIIKASGRDPRQGNVDATITATLVPLGDEATTVELSTDLSITGKLASFGKGGIEDVSKNILGQFVSNLELMLANDASDEEPGARAGEDAPSASESQPGVGSPDVEPLDLASVVAAPVLRRVVPVVLGSVLLSVVVWSLLRRCRT